jgi:hypothetical protein
MRHGSESPSAADIIRARLRTIGVEEHHFAVEKTGDEVYITDVGGSRSQVSQDPSHTTFVLIPC